MVVRQRCVSESFQCQWDLGIELLNTVEKCISSHILSILKSTIHDLGSIKILQTPQEADRTLFANALHHSITFFIPEGGRSGRSGRSGRTCWTGANEQECRERTGGVDCSPIPSTISYLFVVDRVRFPTCCTESLRNSHDGCLASIACLPPTRGG